MFSFSQWPPTCMPLYIKKGIHLSLHEMNRHHAAYFIFYLELRSVKFNEEHSLKSDIQLIFEYVLCGFIQTSGHQNFKFHIYIGRLHYLVPINNTIPFCILPVTQRCNTIIVVIIILYYNSVEWGWRISQRSLTHPRVSQSSRAANSIVQLMSSH